MKELAGSGLRLALSAVALLALSACVVAMPDRYASAYDACDRQAGACYESCRVLDGQRLAYCQDDCSRDVDQCFARVSRAMERDSYRPPVSYAFYGRHGYWSHGYGWRYGRHGRAYSYDPYGYYDPYYRSRRPRYGYRNDPNPDWRGDRDRDRDPDRDDDDRGREDYVYGDDGSVRDRDGRVLRPAGRPGRADPTRGDRTNGVRPGTRSSDPTVRPARPTRPSASEPTRPERPARPKPPRGPKPVSPSRDKDDRQER